MAGSRPTRPRAPLDRPGLESLAMHYAGRYATTEAKLADYLRRKLRERGWSDNEPPPVAPIVARMAELGYVDDAAFAGMRAAALSRRGYGGRRIAIALNAAGVSRELAEALSPDREAAFSAAESFARRRRIGPFALHDPAPEERQRHFAAMVRAGHDYELARYFTQASRNEAKDA